jgi:hypothetical protein
MRKELTVKTSLAGFVHIDRTIGAMRWEKKDVDPILRQYARKYLLCEGFVELAIGALDPAPDRAIVFLLDSHERWEAPEVPADGEPGEE